uniref:RING-type domain-containing protein n=1 Tax=viral metagenome TaxID=1070528 RepID=A0A6C0K8R7_9ZZZZ
MNNHHNIRDYQLDVLSDLTFSRASFFRRHSGIPLHLIRMYLNNETQMMNLLDRLSRPPLQPQPLPPIQTTSLDIPINLIQLLFGSNATVGLGQGQGIQNQFWDAVTIGLTPQQFAAATREYQNTDLAEEDQCCICQESISTEASVDTLCPGPALGDGVTVTNHHSLHRRCATAWFAISTKCPVCRADLRTLNPTNTNAGTTANANASAPGGEPDPSASGGGVHPDVQS